MILQLSEQEVGLAMKALNTLKKSIEIQFKKMNDSEEELSEEDAFDAKEALSAATHQIDALFHKLSRAGLNQDKLD